MHRGCGRPVRTLRTFLYDRAAPSAPCFVLFVCEANDTDCLFGPAFGAPLLIRSALSALSASCGCTCYDQPSCIGAAGGPCARCAPAGAIGRLLAHLCCTFVCEANEKMTPIMWPAFGAPLLIRSALSALDASCDCTWHDQASRIGAAGGPCARCAPAGTIGRLLAHLFCTFCMCESHDTDYDVACFWCSFLLIRSALSSLDASCDCACCDQA